MRPGGTFRPILTAHDNGDSPSAGTPRSVEMARELWHRSSTMRSNSTFSELVSQGIFALLLVSVVLSGIPVVEVHSHEHATFGHSHDAIADHGTGGADSEDSATDAASSHAHDISATSPGMVASASNESTVPQHSHSYIPPPYRWLPDTVIDPIHRPPIA